MKTNFIPVFLLLALAGVGCKKHLSLTPSAPNDTAQRDKKWIVTTIAGNGSPLFADGPAMQASFRAPLDVAVADDGTIYVADALNHRVRKIAGGIVSTFAGDSMGDTTSGNPSVTRFIHPSYLSLDQNGFLFTLDIEDPRVRRISPSRFTSVVAGSGVNTFADGRADTAAFGKECAGIALDENGNIYVSDWKSRRIRKIADGIVSTFAGNGGSGLVNGRANDAQFFNQGGLAADKEGNLYVGDFNRVRKITPAGIVSTFAGKDSIGFRDGPADQALFSSIFDLVIDDHGNVFVSDENRIRKITPQGVVTTIAGGTVGYSDGDGLSAKFYGATGLAIDKQGNIYLADDHNNRIRKISFE